MAPLIEELKEIVGADAVLTRPDQLLVYECDGLPQHKHRPSAVVFPSSTDQVSRVLRLLSERNICIIPRGAGTGLSGGAVALNEGVVIELARMRRLISVDPVNRTVTVETGFINAQVTSAVAQYGLFYAPDPSSQSACTIGGNLAENAGGIHCLKYGTTVDHVLGAKVILSNGEVAEFQSPNTGSTGLDLLGVFVGSEGTFGIVTEATLKLTPEPQSIRTLLADFVTVDAASRAVSEIIASGMIPSALEMMDGAIIRAVEASVFAAGMPLDAGAALLIELDGLEAGIDHEVSLVDGICRRSGARTVRVAANTDERKKLWAARKGAFGAMGRISPDLMLQDTVVPRSRLPEVLADVFRIGNKYGLQVANVFHAGDGNLHPFICYDLRKPGEVDRVREAGREVMETCVRAGGSITGEHGVGLDKSEYLPLIFSEDDLNAMLQVRAAFDPDGILNPGKIIPTSRSCGEGRRFKLPPQTPIEMPQAPSFPALRTSASGLSSAVIEKTTSHTRNMSDERGRVELERIAGSENVIGDRDLSVHPSSVSEARDIFRIATEAGWMVNPVGSERQGLQGGIQPRILCLSTRRLNKIIEHEPADLIVTAEAGTGLCKLNTSLRKSGQWLPLDPPDDGNATIGGVVANGSGGPLAYAYGLPRNLVIGMHVLLGDGRHIKAGGKVVKNVAGYDMCKLFTGSRGSLGLITDLTFKLKPVPSVQRTLLFSGALPDLIDLARQSRDERVGEVASELISASLASQLIAVSEGICLLMKLAGTGEAVDYQTVALGEFAGARKIDMAQIDNDEEIWTTLSRLTYSQQWDVVLRTQLKPSELWNTLAEEEFRELRESGFHCGMNDGRLMILGKFGGSEFNGFRKLITSKGGSLMVERGSASQFLELETPLANPELNSRIKRALDPSGLFTEI